MASGPVNHRLSSLRAVAAAAEVSVATASRALRGLSGVSDQKVDAVREAARRLGYRPDPALAALSRYRWPQGPAPGPDLAILHLHDRFNALYVEMRDTIQAWTRDHGYAVVELLADQDGAAVAQLLRRRRIAGVLINLHEDAPFLFADGFPDSCAGVILGEGHRHLKLPRVSTDWAWVYLDAAARLVAFGHRRIGCLIRRFAGTDLTGELRAAAMACLPGQADPPPILVLDGPVSQQREAIRDWQARHHLHAVIADGPEPAALLDAALAGQRGRPMVICSIIGRRSDGRSGYRLDLALRCRLGLDLLHLAVLRGRMGSDPLAPRMLVPSVWEDGDAQRP